MDKDELRDSIVAWREFDGEGGYTYTDYENNESRDIEWAARNPKYVGWVEPLYLVNMLTNEQLLDISSYYGFIGDQQQLIKFIRGVQKEMLNGK